MELKLEVVVLPVADVDRSIAFYRGLDFRLDADFAFDDGFRVVQLTPPGSAASIFFGSGIADQAPGSVQELHLVVTDIVAARDEIAAAGVDISDVWHGDGAFHRAGGAGRISGPHPARASYGSFASFTDPDGNGWVLQEIVTRAPGR
ncbi:MAG TPA: VOC family protein [Agromyces sp.]